MSAVSPGSQRPGALEADDREQEEEPVVLDEVGHGRGRLSAAEPHKITRCASASRVSSSQASAEWHSSRTPSTRLASTGFDVVVERGAGAAASFPDDAYASRRRRRLGRRRGMQMRVVKVRKPNAEESQRLRYGQVLIGFLEPLTDRAGIERLAERGVHAFAMESIPRITRAQPMDALSSQATVSGYKAVLIAADHLPRFFPMLMTAAGTVAPAKAFVLGAGVAGLQAIATARRLGAVVFAFDVRPVVREQVESLGATFLDLGVVGEETAGGYARELTGDEQRRQQEALEERIPDYDVVITTALIPGRAAPTADSRERRREDAARIGDRRPCGRGGRQLRADLARRDRRARRRHASSA